MQKQNAIVNADHFCEFEISVHFLLGRNFLGWLSQGVKLPGGKSAGENSQGGNLIRWGFFGWELTKVNSLG